MGRPTQRKKGKGKRPEEEDNLTSPPPDQRSGHFPYSNEHDEIVRMATDVHQQVIAKRDELEKF
jgi:hypothetical protein